MERKMPDGAPEVEGCHPVTGPPPPGGPDLGIEGTEKSKREAEQAGLRSTGLWLGEVSGAGPWPWVPI